MRKIGTGEKGCVCVYVNKTRRMRQQRENERRYKGNENRDSVKHLIRYR